MRTLTKFFIVLAAIIFMMIPTIHAQDRPVFLTVTTIHWNMDLEDFSMEDWKAIEKEYFDKVTMKNEYIVHANILMHYFTGDNSELKVVFGYRSWDDIEKAQERNDELEVAAWPDEAKRKEFLKKRNHYYSSKHSDEIYATLPGALFLKEKPTEPMVYYVRVEHLAYPEGGSNDEMNKLRKEFIDNVFAKNNYIKGYYPSRHAWGSDGRDYVEAFVVSSLADLESALKENQALIEDHWKDEKAKKEYFDAADKYFTGWHGDFIFRHVPELMK